MKAITGCFNSYGKVLFIYLQLLLHTSVSGAQKPLWNGQGRIVLSADGNEHDHDDWAGMPLSLALLAAKGLQNKVPVYIYADHIWGSNHEHPGIDGITPYEQMKIGALKGGKIFGFKKTNFICAVDNPEIAYEALKAEINSSTADNPLFIIVQGPVQVIGEAIARADSTSRKFVTIISTDNAWNDDHADKPYGDWDQHTGWTIKKIVKEFGNGGQEGVKIVSIPNQNPYLKKNWHEYTWLKTAPERNNAYYKKGSWLWLFNRLVLSVKPDAEGDSWCYSVDPSDAGKVIFLLTGIEKGSPALCYEIMKNPPGTGMK